MWQTVGYGLPKSMGYHDIYAVRHVRHGVIFARGNESDWHNGMFSHWHTQYKYNYSDPALNTLPKWEAPLTLFKPDYAIEVSPVFHVVEEKKYVERPFSRVATPWTFYITVQGYLTFPSNEKDVEPFICLDNVAVPCGWATKSEAEEVRDRYLNNIASSLNDTVTIVLFTPPWHKATGRRDIQTVFRHIGDAHQYIIRQGNGKQNRDHHYGVTPNGQLFVEVSYPDYHVQVRKIQETIKIHE